MVAGNGNAKRDTGHTRTRHSTATSSDVARNFELCANSLTLLLFIIFSSLASSSNLRMICTIYLVVPSRSTRQNALPLRQVLSTCRNSLSAVSGDLCSDVRPFVLLSMGLGEKRHRSYLETRSNLLDSLFDLTIYL